MIFSSVCEDIGSFVGLHLKIASWADVSCTVRDYRESASKTENINIRADESASPARVRGDTEVVFQVLGSTSPQVFKIECVLSIHLSA